MARDVAMATPVYAHVFTLCMGWEQQHMELHSLPADFLKCCASHYQPHAEVSPGIARARNLGLSVPSGTSVCDCPDGVEVRSKRSTQRAKQARVRVCASKTRYRFRRNTTMCMHHHLQVWTGRRPVQSTAEPQPNSSEIRGRVVPHGDSDSVSIHPFPIYQSHFALKYLPSNWSTSRRKGMVAA